MQLLNIFLAQKRVCTDTRQVQKGDIFFALKGEKFNGNEYAAKALEMGAAYVVVDDENYFQREDERYIWSEDSLKTLQALGTAYRRTLNIPIIGITGTNGKTTTKELIYSVLQTEKRTYATKGNLNNHIGVPLSLLAIPQDAEIAVIEMGANQPDDIKELAEIAEPTHGVITNIGKAHLERLKNIEGVKTVKKQLFDFIGAHNGKAFVNMADKNVRDAATEIPLTNFVTFGANDSQFHYNLLSHTNTEMELEIFLENQTKPEIFRTQLTGEYNCMNILVAVAIGAYFGLSLESLKKGIFSYLPTNQRSQIIEKPHFSIWLDAYNANPSSMKAAVRNIITQNKDKRVLLILGDMFELGEVSEQEHRDLGKHIQEFSPEFSILVGKEMKYTFAEIESEAVHFEGVEDAKNHLRELILAHKPQFILLKGSRGMAMERLLPILEENFS
jgi:UDP-N-acetylmuramoyl-tripeptide--D-alanyl-D-alanine ligase